MIGLPRDLPAHATQPSRNLLIFLDLNSGISLALEPLRGRLRSGVANSTAPSSRAPVRSGALGAPRRTVATRGSRPLGCRNSSARPGHRVSRWQERALRAGEAAQGGNVRMKNERLRPGLGMRLSSKIFLSSALVIVVLAGVSALSLGAVGRLVSVNREITTRTIPALSLTASAREAIPPLLGLEARAVVLGDRRYTTAWTELAARIAEDLERLAEYALSEREARHLREASAAFEEYRRIVAEEQALLGRGDRARAVRLTDAAARVLGVQVRESLDELMAAARALVQLDGESAAPAGGDEAGVLRHRLPRAPVAAHVDPRCRRPPSRARSRPPHGKAGAPDRHHRAELRAAAPARQSDPRDVAPARGARGGRAEAARPREARGPRRRGASPAGRGVRCRRGVRALRVALRVPRRRGTALPARGQPRRQRDSLYPARRACRRSGHRRELGVRAPGRGHGCRHPR